MAQVVRLDRRLRAVMAQDVTSVDEVLPALARVLQAIAERVLSADAVGMFRLLTADFPAAAAGLPGERIERTAMLGRLVPTPGQARTHPGERAPRRGRPAAAVHGDRRTVARHGAGADAAPPESSIGERRPAWRCSPETPGLRAARRVMRCARVQLAARRRGDLAKRAHGDTLNRQRAFTRCVAGIFLIIQGAETHGQATE